MALTYKLGHAIYGMHQKVAEYSCTPSFQCTQLCQHACIPRLCHQVWIPEQPGYCRSLIVVARLRTCMRARAIDDDAPRAGVARVMRG
jgi:hypothetical protein